MVVKLQMGVWAGIAAGSVMVMLVLLPILGCMFSRNKKAKKAAELEESAAEKGEVTFSAPALAQTREPARPVNTILQKPAVHVSQQKIRTQPSTHSIAPSYQSQSSTLAPGSPLRNSTPSPPLPPHMQPMWTKPSLYNIATSNNHVCIISQIESIKGVENIQEISAVPGVSALMFGLGDYMIDAGLGLSSALGGVPHQMFAKAVGRFGATAHATDLSISG
ncbi:uncharacterized protein M421DRAFT_1288 [Didymella exigua CBS 183.55]|uniref:HpcH/HpaI aldolase/citrate lyase domain-containing protein n=1 Tax=Didymella exigua CBS 183.55 TaxID=1150837 RepID=A0A6A5RYT8_9PLEO|nr:uncharacterized protein M421DRAFT_1288 [Didymella exigua CBS 183.55]KAF1932679.1 hypothetical protein M421DRAFT_1288 [Didymella exigua CBS 183.55]